MNLNGQLQRITKIDELIRTRRTGDPSELAKKVLISESLLYSVLNAMKSMGAPLKYSRKLQTYFYTSPVKFFCGYLPDEQVTASTVMIEKSA